MALLLGQDVKLLSQDVINCLSLVNTLVHVLHHLYGVAVLLSQLVQLLIL